MNSYWINVIEQLNVENKTQADIAKELNISTGTVNNWIKHDRYPPVDRAVLIAKFLNTTSEALVTGNVKNGDQLINRILFDEDFNKTTYQLSQLDHNRFIKLQGMVELYYTEYLTEDNKELNQGIS